MKKRVLFSGGVIAAGLLVGTALLPERQQATGGNPWRLESRTDRLRDLFPRSAGAVPLCDIGVASVEKIPMTLFAEEGYSCTGSTMYTEATQTTYCDGSAVVSDPNMTGLLCAKTAQCASGNFVDWTINCLDGNVCGNQTNCSKDGPEINAGVVCESRCDPPPPESCCPGDNPGCTPECLGNPVSVAYAELSFEIPVFPLSEGAGFPPRFSVYWNGKDSLRRGYPGNSLGAHGSHTFSLYFYKSKTPAGADVAAVSIEDGGKELFTWNGSGWIADEGRKSSLSAGGPGTCLAEGATLTRPDGSVYRFSDWCTGAATEGQPLRVERPNGDFMAFETNASGLITRVRNRRDAWITFGYGPPHEYGEPYEHWGNLEAVVTPEGYRFEFEARHGNLEKILGPNVSWTIEADDAIDGDMFPGMLRSVKKGTKLVNAWEWSGGANGEPVLVSESGPGTDPLTKLTFAEGVGDSLHVTFRPAGSATDVTNDYFWAQQPGASRRVTSRTVAGTCPNCGEFDLTRTFWSGSNNVRGIEEGNGSVSLYEDLGNPGVESFAYDAQGNPLVVNEGCTGTASSPDCSGSRTSRFSYKAGTSAISAVERPSVTGGTVTNSTTFDGSSTRVDLEKTEGHTATSLDGVLQPTPKQRIIDYDYAVITSGFDLTVVKGPYWEDAGFTTSDPRTDYAWNSSTSDSCGIDVPSNLGRLGSITRWVDGTRKLVTQYCNYDASGRARRIKNPDGTITDLTYDWQGNVTKTVVDVGGLALTTDSAYDSNGNLITIRLPRSTPDGRTGFKYFYDDADRVTEIRQGYFGSSFVTLQWIRIAYDQWGNRTKTEYLDENDAVSMSEGAKYDAFNRLLCLTRPAATDPDCDSLTIPGKTSFGYDREGRLIRVTDAQGDDVKYGSIENIESYDRFGNLTRVSQEICEHLPGDPGGIDGACSTSRFANIDYVYDPALQLAEVQVQDAVRGGTITTRYVTDDFGQVVKIESPDSGTSFFRYDGAGQMVETEDARGKRYQFEYDRLGRLTKRINATGTPVTEIRYCYDGLNSACGVHDVVDYTDGRLSGVEDTAGASRFAYDGAGRLVTEIRETTAGASFTTSYAYDENGNRTSVTHPNGLRIARTFDAADRETLIQWCVGTTCTNIIENFTWHPFGPVWAFFHSSSPNGLRYVAQRDSAGRINLTRISDSLRNPVAKDEYEYANDGNVSAHTVESGATTILHDSLSRLKSDASGSYVLDDAGNRTTGPGGDLTYPSASSDRWSAAEAGTIGYTLDAAGNVTARGGTTIGYSDSGTVTSVATGSGTTTYKRDYRNLRLEKAGAGGAGTFFHDLNGQLIQWTGPVKKTSCGTKECTLRDGSTGTCIIYTKQIPHETYIHLAGVPVAMVQSHVETECDSSTYGSLIVDGVFHYYADKMGVPRRVFRNDTLVWTAEFDAWGKPRSMNEDPDGNGLLYKHYFRLPGQYALTPPEGGPTATAGGLVENWHRVYDSQIGRYLQPDPAGIVPDGVVADSPWGMPGVLNHTYGYAAQSPLEWIDPDAARPYVLPRRRKPCGPDRGDLGPIPATGVMALLRQVIGSSAGVLITPAPIFIPEPPCIPVPLPDPPEPPCENEEPPGPNCFERWVANWFRCQQRPEALVDNCERWADVQFARCNRGMPEQSFDPNKIYFPQ